MPFDLSEALKGVPIPVSQRDELRYIAYANIIPDPNNGYSMDGVEELARNIELVGLQQPLRVRLRADDTVDIISGHRRHAAIGLLIDRDSHAFDDGVPCIVEKAAASAALRELQLILGNADNRAKTPADLLRDVEGLADCLCRLEAEGYHFPGRHREWISRMVGMSKTKIGRLQAIGKHLAPSLLQHFNNGELGITTAYRLSQEPEQIQHEVYRIYGKGINDLTEPQLEEAIARRKAPRQDPPSKVASNEKAGFDVDAYLENRRNEDDDFFEMLCEVARHFIEELDVLNSRGEGIETLKRGFGMSYEGHAGPGNMVCYDAKPKGLTLYRHGAAQIFRTWTEVYDMLCLIALNRVAIGEGLDEDEDDEPEKKLPTVRWESRAVTPPQREPLLLYQLTNAGPKYTPAVYCGGAVFRKPAWAGQTGAELNGIAQQFSFWLKFPDPNSYGEEYLVEPPKELTSEELQKTLAQSPVVLSPDTAYTAPAWHTGEPPKAGLYYCRLTWAKPTVLKWNPERRVFSYPASGGELTGELPDWYPLPEVDA